MASIFRPMNRYRLETESNPWILSSIPQTFVLRLMDHEQVLFIGKVKALQSVNRYGSFSILAGHTNFISIIYKKLFYYPAVGDKKELDIDSGMLRYLNNSADIYLGIESSEELDQLQLEAIKVPKDLEQQKLEFEQNLAKAEVQAGGPDASSPGTRE